MSVGWLSHPCPPWMLRDADQRPACVHVGDDPIAVECLIGQHRIEADPVDQGGHADRVKAVSRQQNEPHKIAQGVCQGEDFGGPAAL